MIDPWSGIATLLATVIEKYGAAVLQELDAEASEKTTEEGRQNGPDDGIHTGNNHASARLRGETNVV